VVVVVVARGVCPGILAGLLTRALLRPTHAADLGKRPDGELVKLGCIVDG
jgi:hypothetical protein